MGTAAMGPFVQLLTREQFGLAEASLLIAQDAYPALDVSAYLARLDAMAQAIVARIPADAFPEQRLAALNYYLFRDLGIRGNTEHYDDPRNSYLNEVIDRGMGIPITLSILYMEVGQRIGLPLRGVSFPGHFLVKLRLRRGQLVLDPFLGGAPQSEQMLRRRLRPFAATGQEPETMDPYLEAATPRQILMRLLGNLKIIYLKTGALESALAVLSRMVRVEPDAAEVVRDRGLVYDALECFRPALHDLEAYLARRPGAPDALELRERVTRLRRAAARLN